jgi:hypothetical protein
MDAPTNPAKIARPVCPFCAWPLAPHPELSPTMTGEWVLCANPRCPCRGEADDADEE